MVRLSLLFLCFSTLQAFSGTTFITGCSPEHAGSRLIFYEYSEKVFNTRKNVFEIYPDHEGCFNAEIWLSETKYLFAEDGARIYFFYAEPDRSYSLELPPPREKTLQEKRNPFFIPEEIHLTVKLNGRQAGNNGSGINEVIRRYDELFYPFYDEQILRYLSPLQSYEKLDSFLLATEVFEDFCDNDYFRLYKFYREGLLKFSVSQFNMNEIITDYFLNKSIQNALPPYWELFNMVFDNYFSYLTDNEEFGDLYRLIAGTDYSALESLLIKDPVMGNGTIRGLVLLAELHNEFHGGSFSGKVITALLDSLALHSESALCRELALSVKEANTRLQPGSVAPSLSLKDANGRDFDIHDLKGKLVYLGFCRPDMTECQKEFEYLKFLHHHFGDRLVIITAFEGISTEELAALTARSDYGWLASVLTEPEKAYRDFNIRGMPAFYFIDQNSRFVQSPANLPSSGFEKILIQFLRKY